MPNMLDGMAILPPVKFDETCPICGEKSHPERTTKAKKEGKGCLKSIPKNLGCEPIKIDDSLPNYTTAAHHLIPVNQCLKRFPRLSQMANVVGYDANNKENGLALPTCAQGDLNKYDTSDGKTKKYGKLSDDDKENTAFTIMKGLDKQWHVGHHNWKIKIDHETDNDKHHPNYDKLVKRDLRDLEEKFCKKAAAICEPEKGDSGDAVINELNRLSKKINKNISGWKKYFVSRHSYNFKRKV